MGSTGRKTVVTRQLIEEVKAYRANHSQAETAKAFGIAGGLVSNIQHGKTVPIEDKTGVDEEPTTQTNTHVEYQGDSGSLDISVRHPKGQAPRWLDIKTPAKLLEVCEVDTSVWEPAKITVSSSEVTMRLRSYAANGGRLDDEPVTYTNVHIRVALKRRSPEARSLEALLDEIRKHGAPKIAIRKAPRGKGKPRRQLEISICDPHLGMTCYKPPAEHDGSIEWCKTTVMDILERLLDHAAVRGPFEKIIWPFGHDFLHADNVWHTTTQGTPQPESESWHHIYLEGEKLAIAMAERMRQVAPLEVYAVPGNHDRQSTFTLGRLLAARYHNSKDVVVHATGDPYYFHSFGVCLIGFEHGHSIKQTVRLAALMANETRLKGWQQARYCEWHLGDQHRKGSCRPQMFEEQGVSVEFLPGLTPVNEWHRLKSFNWQKRAGAAFVWDHDAGLTDRYFVNIDNYSQQIMGV